MIDLTELDRRLQAHLTTTDRINRQAWHWYADRSGDRGAVGTRPRFGRRLGGAVRAVPALCRAAGRLLALPNHRGVNPL
ncbi:MAG: hypothetical protein QOJ59_2953 [Thermomicrobiales bacterium]|jgi:hypothetical protein|nr:hypothetical protein [Thermomicrobiales bacterium]